jgi:hypothetical protein
MEDWVGDVLDLVQRTVERGLDDFRVRLMSIRFPTP